MNLIHKLLLRKHLSWTQLTGFFVAGLAGMSIVLFGIQAWSDIHPFFRPSDGFIQKEYIVITKKVSALSLLNKQGNLFTDEECTELSRQGFVDRLGAFTASRFKVSAGIDMAQIGVSFATEMFFESVPDDFVDVRSEQWHYTPGDPVIPIILPRNYLNLYNFGYAQSRNLPKISEGVIGMVNLDVRLSGNGKRQNFKGKIVGFSNRLNTILVPESFIEWGNNTFSSAPPESPSRLIIETENPADKEIARYFSEKGYEAENDKLNDGSVVWFLNLLTFLVVGIGLIICLLSLYLLTISIYLIIEKNSEKLKNLLLLGYREKEIAAPYNALILWVNTLVVVLSLAGIAVARSLYIPFLTRIWPEFSPGGFAPALLCGAALFIVVCGINILAVRRRIHRL